MDMNFEKIAEIAIEKGAQQKITEFSPLISFLKGRKLDVIVEIGTARGGTLYAWCEIAEPTAKIISMDLPGGAHGGGYSLDDVERFKKYKRQDQELYFLRENSHKQSTKNKLEEMLGEQKIDFLFLDGDHTYKGAKKDWQMYASLVKENGFIALHDILHHPKIPKCKVDKLWNEIKSNYKHFEFVDKEDDRGWGQWGGIGLIDCASR